ncbi:MAG: bifunctional hydroxymethylpyrimidine kinase/phosphomethylpyrimidine kinase [Planctomycetota bacterium]|jgi:hydroxymethylpyrimidine/phosphomethylpyrimidine kinase|nr:bifunctional hydroxymethylpyrimidine kinase/phosphomethylpyrimidine kinase [Planctomycetota bacterium]
MKHVLTIAGSDSGGSAGIQADLKTMCALGVFGMSALTAVTAQNTMGVRGVHEIPHEIVTGQIDAVFEDIRVDAVKVGMVANSAVARAVRAALSKHAAVNVVVDPVMVAKSGDRLLSEDSQREIMLLAAGSALVTPNLYEAELLAGVKIRTRADMREAALRIRDQGVGNILVKGGRFDGDADDFLLIGDEEIWLECPRIKTRNTNGTGCTLSSAIACGLAEGMPLRDAATEAKKYVTQAIRDGLDVGCGAGPLGHLVRLYRAVSPLTSPAL